jgi:lipid-binding SYLF domain-containing protein
MVPRVHGELGMPVSRRLAAGALAAAIVALFGVVAAPAGAATAREIDAAVDAALAQLLGENEAAARLNDRAKGILVFPNVVKGGLIIGGLYGDGALRKAGKTVGYYNTVAASIGLQAGAQSFGYALFFMTDAALERLDASGGFEVGLGPSLVVADKGLAAQLSTTTALKDIYAFIFGQQGLMAGVGIEGTKITRFAPEP